jgi:hypothetical protein
MIAPPLQFLGGYVAIVDAVQRAVIDKGASKATRKAAFSALLALVEAGLLIGDTSTSSPARDGNSPAPAHVRTGLHLMGRALQDVAGSPLGAGKTLARPMPSALAISVAGRHLVLSSRALADGGKR